MDKLTLAKEDKKELELKIQSLLNDYMTKHKLVVIRVGTCIEEFHTTPFASTVDVEVKI